jgi:hypothetical protein
MGSPYALTPLDPKTKCFRLLELQPSDSDDIIKCTLRTYPLASHPSYTALSYTWGPPSLDHIIELNGIQTPIRANLWSFLNRRRLRNEYDPLWADAICIDQSRVHELNHQVQMMRQIYESAANVSIWLGDAADNSDEAMQILKLQRLSTLSATKSQKAWEPDEGRAILSLCKRKYWRRMWIIQELFVAKHAVIHCGTHDLEWQILVDFLAQLHDFKKRGRDIYIPQAHNILASPAMAIVREKAKWGRTPQPLKRLIQTYREHESTEIRDKIYALLGIAEGTSEVVVDYHKSAKTVLLDVYCNEVRCGAWDVRQQTRRRGELIRFRKALQDILDVTVSEAEVFTHAGCPKEWMHTSTRRCHFEFLGCEFKTHQQFEWEDHCLTHFNQVEPPRTMYCIRCDMPRVRYEDGWTAWRHKMNHEMSHRHEKHNSDPQPDFYLFQHLWQTKLIDDLDLEELLVGSHRLALPPLSRTHWDQEAEHAWEGHVEGCTKQLNEYESHAEQDAVSGHIMSRRLVDQICVAKLHRPVLAPLDQFRRSDWDATESDCAEPVKGVIDHVQQHILDSQKKYRNWHSNHLCNVVGLGINYGIPQAFPDSRPDGRTI